MSILSYVTVAADHQNAHPDQDWQFDVKYKRAGWADQTKFKNRKYYNAQDADRCVRNILVPKRAGLTPITDLTVRVRPVGDFELVFGPSWPWGDLGPLVLLRVEAHPIGDWQQLADLADLLDWEQLADLADLLEHQTTFGDL